MSTSRQHHREHPPSSLAAVLDEIRADLREIRELLRSRPAETPRERWLRPKDLPWPKGTVSRLVKAGRLTARRVGRTMLIDRVSFERLLAERNGGTAESTSTHKRAARGGER